MSRSACFLFSALLWFGTSPLLAADPSVTDGECDANGAALEQARAVLKSSPLVDGHNDLPWVMRETTGGDVAAMHIDTGTEYDTDIPRLREGLVGAQFWSVWVPGELEAIDFGRVQMEQIDIARRIITFTLSALP